MTDGGGLRLWEAPLPTTPTEWRTTLFYAWERRGRGWWVWPYPVELEPPFRPLAVEIPALPVADDARHHTWLSAFAERVRNRLTGTGSVPAAPTTPTDIVIDEPSPDPCFDESPGAAFQVALPPGAKIAREMAERFLLSLKSCTRPVCFEVVGDSLAITVQLVCWPADRSTVREQLRAYFPESAVVEEPDPLWRSWQAAGAGTALVVDFGLAHECMRPLQTIKSLDPDPLIGVSGALSDLAAGEVGALQVLFAPCRAPWAGEIARAVTDSEGRPFFTDAPEMVSLARAKLSRPLFAGTLRVAAKSSDRDRAWTITRALAGALTPFADPVSNELIPLSPEDYLPDEQEALFLERLTRRSGMLLNVEELVSLVHLPSASVRAPKLRREAARTKAAPASVTGDRYRLGANTHAGTTVPVTLSPAQRLRHTYLIGASGTGKSTLLLDLVSQDLANGEGIGVLDPHGDLIDRILERVPENRTGDVILLDPADEAYPIGFNILSAHSELEKTLLASDLVAVFRRLSTSWGDQMTSVLGNAILAFLESTDGGTLADLRRFLVEKEYRQRFLKTVADREIVYYWEREFPLLAGKPQAPLLTRLDTFLRPKLIRHMVAQRTNALDFAAIMNEGKIFLAKLSQGAIGEENAALLGSLLIAKVHQAAISRQQLKESQRRAYYIYVDEFQYFVTPSMAQILSGARKYGLGLILAHQDLRQLASQSPELLGAALSNPCTRICFRVGDLDAKRLEDGFSAFDAKDLQNLGVGEAIARIERADWDFNLKTRPLDAVDEAAGEARRDRIVAASRARYGTPRETVEAALREAAASGTRAAGPPDRVPTGAAAGAPGAVLGPEEPGRATRRPPTSETQPERPARQQAAPSEAPSPPALGRGGPQHKYLQELIKRWAEANGYRAAIEEPILDGLGSVDVALEKGGVRIACEVSVTTSPEHELANVQKCLAAGFNHVVVVGLEPKPLRKTNQLVEAQIEESLRARVKCSTPEELFAFLEELDAGLAATEHTVGKYRVKVRHKPLDEADKAARKQVISQMILRAMKRLKGSS